MFPPPQVIISSFGHRSNFFVLLDVSCHSENFRAPPIPIIISIVQSSSRGKLLHKEHTDLDGRKRFTSPRNEVELNFEALCFFSGRVQQSYTSGGPSCRKKALFVFVLAVLQFCGAEQVKPKYGVVRLFSVCVGGGLQPRAS